MNQYHKISTKFYESIPMTWQAVPLEQPSAAVPEVPASQPTQTTQPQNDVSSADFNDDISKI